MADVFRKWFKQVNIYCSCLELGLWGVCNKKARRGKINPNEKPPDYETTQRSNEFTVELVVETLVDELCFISSSAGGKAQCASIYKQNIDLIAKKYPKKILKNKQTRDIVNDITQTRQVAIIADIFIKIALVFGIVNTTMHLNNQKQNIVAYIQSRYLNMTRNIKKSYRSKIQFLSKLFYVRSILNTSNKVIKQDTATSIRLGLNDDMAIINWLWILKKENRQQIQKEKQLTEAVNELNLLQKQITSMKNNISNRSGLGGSYNAEYASMIVELSTKTQISNSKLYSVSQAYYNLLKPICGELGIIPSVPKSHQTIQTFKNVFIAMAREHHWSSCISFGFSNGIDAKTLTGTSNTHALVDEVITFLPEFDATLHWIDKVFFNNERSKETSLSVFRSLQEYWNSIELSLEHALFIPDRFEIHDNKLVNGKINLNWYNGDTCTTERGAWYYTLTNSFDMVISRYSIFAGDGCHKIHSCAEKAAARLFGSNGDNKEENAMDYKSKLLQRHVSDNKQVTEGCMMYSVPGEWNRINGGSSVRFTGKIETIEQLINKRLPQPKKRNRNTTIKQVSNSNIAVQTTDANNGTQPQNNSTDTKTLYTTLNINYKEIIKNNNQTLNHFDDSIILLEDNHDLTETKEEIDDNHLLFRHIPSLIKDLLARESSKTLDFSRIIKIAACVSTYVCNDASASGNQCFDLVDILSSRLEIIQMVIYKESCEIGLSGLLHIYDSNFSRSNCLHSNILKALNLYKIVIQCLEQRIESLHHAKLCAMFDLWLKHNSWAQFNGRKKCYMSSTNCKKYTTLRFCNNEHNDGMCCDTHCHHFDDAQINLKKISVVLPPDLSTLHKDIVYLLEFDSKLIEKTKIDGENETKILNKVFDNAIKFLDSEECKLLSKYDQLDDEDLHILLIMLAYVTCKMIQFKMIERFNEDFQPSTVIPLAIGDPNYGQYFAQIMVKQDKEILIEDTAAKLGFEMGPDLVESLKKDEIHPFETILGWLWPFLWDQLSIFAKYDNDENKNDNNDNSKKYINLRTFAIQQTACQPLWLWHCAMSSQYGQTMRIEVFNKKVDHMTSQEKRYDSTITEGMFPAENFHHCMSPSPNRFSVNQSRGVKNEKWIEAPGKPPHHWHSLLIGPVDKTKYHNIRRKNQKKNQTGQCEKQKWRNAKYSQSKEIHHQQVLATINSCKTKKSKTQKEKVTKDKKKHFHQSKKNAANKLSTNKEQTTTKRHKTLANIDYNENTMDSDVLLDLVPSSLDTQDEDTATNQQTNDTARRKAAIKNINAIEILIMNIKERLNDDNPDSKKIVNDSRQQICKILGCNEDILPPFSIFRSSLHNDCNGNDDIIAYGLDLNKSDVLEMFESVFDNDKDNDDTHSDDCGMSDDENNEEELMTGQQYLRWKWT